MYYIVVIFIIIIAFFLYNNVIKEEFECKNNIVEDKSNINIEESIGIDVPIPNESIISKNTFIVEEPPTKPQTLPKPIKHTRHGPGYFIENDKKENSTVEVNELDSVIGLSKLVDIYNQYNSVPHDRNFLEGHSRGPLRSNYLYPNQQRYH